MNRNVPDTGTTETDGSSTHTKVLGDLDESLSHLGLVGAGGGLAESSTDGVALEEGGGLLALHGGGDGVGASGSCTEKRVRLGPSCINTVQRGAGNAHCPLRWMQRGALEVQWLMR